MGTIGHALDRDWEQLNRSPQGRRALRRWAEQEEALAGLSCLDDILERRLDEKLARPVLAALARLAPTDPLAARTLLQAVLPGLVRIAADEHFGDRDALDHLVALAWERIITYPLTRPGSVAANVLWDVRKRYRRERAASGVGLDAAGPFAEPTEDSVEDAAIDRAMVDQVVAAQRRGVISDAAFALILRTRMGGEFLHEVAAGGGATVHALNQRRWRAERQLRLALAG